MLPANSLITLAEFIEYVNDNNHDVDPDALALKETLIGGACQIVRSKIGYDPIKTVYENELYSGTGSNILSVDARPLVTVESFKVNGIEVDTTDFILKPSFIYTGTYTIPKGFYNILLDFTAGYEAEEIPSLIKTTVLRIAGILWSESGGKVGVSGHSTPDGNRTFNDRRFEKYLEPLGPYCIKRI